MAKQYKKKLVLIPSAYNGKVMGDVSNFIKYYKDIFDLYVIYDQKEQINDDVKYINNKSAYADYLKYTADYIIDAGSINGKTYVNNTQKRISVWHGIPYKKMFIDLDKTNIVDGLEYNHGVDLMVSPSKFYSEEFLRKSMLYNGEILETAVSRTDDLYLSDKEKEKLKEELGIPNNKKIVLYAPTYRKAGKAQLPFNSDKLINALNNKSKDEWLLVTKLHYLNTLSDVSSNIIDLTKYSNVNNLLAISDILITDYSSLMFDYSILEKPALFFQYDKTDYEKDRGFMFDLEDYVDKKYIIETEEELLKQIVKIKNDKNLEKIKKTFYPHQKKDSTKQLVNELNLDKTVRKTKDIIFLVNTLNEIGGVHSFILNLAREFKSKYNSKIFVFGANEFANKNESVQIFDKDNLIDIKLSYEKSKKIVENILKNTDGYVISCQFSAHKTFQSLLKNKNSLLMFHGDTKDVVNKSLYKWHLNALNKRKLYNYKSLVLLTESNKKVIDKHLIRKINKSSTFIEDSIDFNNPKDFYKENNEFVIASRFASDKNIFEVLNIFSSNNLNKNYKVHIYGDGPLKAKFIKEVKEKGLEEKVIVHDYCSDKDIIYKDKQGMILTSLSEGFSLIILEAVNYGIPVYLYDSYTACDEFRGYNNIRLIEKSNVEAFVKELNIGILVKKDEFKKIQDKYSNETIIKKWINLFDDINNYKQIKPSVIPLLKDKIKTFLSNVKRKVKSIIKKIVFKTIDIKTKWFTDIILNVQYYLYKIKNIIKPKSNPLVSFIVPFYNNLSTIEDLLKSIKKGKYKNYEVLVINDGSKENPEDICKKYKKVKYFYKENEGLGKTRNFGINHASGKYVYFIDSDDTLCKGAIRYLVDYAEKHKLDMVSGLCRRIYVQTKKISFWYRKIYNKNYINTKEDRDKLISDTISTAKLYNLEALRKSGIEFEKGLYEDKLYISKIYNHFEKIGVIKYMVYNWHVYGDNSSITTSFTYENTKERLDRIINIFNNAKENQKLTYYNSFINHDLYVFVKNYLKYDENTRNKIYNLFKDFFIENKKYFYPKYINSIYKIDLFNCFINDDFDRFNTIAECIFHTFKDS